MKQNNAFRVRESEFRWVIHETHSCQAERLENAVHVKIRRRKDVPWEGTVHVYEVRGHPNATRCYAWVEPLGKTRSSFGRCCTPTRFLRLKKRCNRRCVGHAESPQSSRKFGKIGHFAGGETQTLPLSLDARSEAPRIFPIRPELNIQLINYRVGSGVPRSLYR